jgi:hypothetical protein
LVAPPSPAPPARAALWRGVLDRWWQAAPGGEPLPTSTTGLRLILASRHRAVAVFGAPWRDRVATQVCHAMTSRPTGRGSSRPRLADLDRREALRELRELRGVDRAGCDYIGVCRDPVEVGPRHGAAGVGGEQAE